ncbi:dihydroorotate oxidase [Candidatus Gottesmanbacteria bacterium]|nr:dihydroorotate oxidase [Candidatus Gottesmanbacteria bacterium]
MKTTPFYDPLKTYEENYQDGPFGAFTEKRVARPPFIPFGIPAGPLLNGKFINSALNHGFDIPIHKTVRTRKYKCHPWPNVLAVHIKGDLTIEKASNQLVADTNYSWPLSITNSFGNPSRDPDIWQKDIKKSVKHAKKGQMVWGSFEGTHWDGSSAKDYINDWVLGAKLLKEANAQAVEANFSCPNEGTANLLCFDVAKVQIICNAIKNEIGNTSLYIKTAYYQDQKLLEKLVENVGKIVDGFSSINTIQAEVVGRNGKQALPGEGRKRSGICGESIRWAGLNMVARLKKLREKLGFSYKIVGVGGVMTARDYFEYRKNGADIVMSATGAMWNPLLAQDIKKR